MELEWRRKHFLAGKILDKDKMGVGMMPHPRTPLRSDARDEALHTEPEEEMDHSPQHDVQPRLLMEKRNRNVEPTPLQIRGKQDRQQISALIHAYLQQNIQVHVK